MCMTRNNRLNLKERMAYSLIMTGTPTDPIKQWVKLHPETASDCSFNRAINANLICRPVLNLIKFATDEDMPSAIMSMVENEVSECSKDSGDFRVKSLVCSKGIDEIHSVVRVLKAVHPEWHYVIIHSTKKINNNNVEEVLESEVDGKVLRSNKVFEVLNQMDDNQYEPFNTDNNPIVVFQVDMIGEGISIKSFNSVFVTSKMEIKMLQQIGRTLRDCKDANGNSKISHGHASVYCGYTNREDLRQMMINLNNARLTDDCFSFGAKIDVSNSSSVPTDPNGVPEKVDYQWNALEKKDIDIIYDCGIRSHANLLASRFNDKQKDEIVAFISKYYKELSGLNLSRVSNLNLGRFDKATKTLKKKATKTTKTNKVKATTKAEEEAEETTMDSAMGIIADIHRAYHSQLNTFGTRENRIYFDNDVEFRKDIFQSVGFEGEIVDFLDNLFTDCNLYRA